MKRSSTSRIFKEMQIKSTVRYHLTQVRMAIIKKSTIINAEVQFNSVTQLCLTLCDPMDCSMPGFPVHHQLLELAQTHVHWDGDAIQPSHPLSTPSLPACNLSQHQGLWRWCGEKGTLLHSWWMQIGPLPSLLWRTVQSYLKKLKIDLPYGLAIPLLSTYQRKLKFKKIYAPQCSLQDSLLLIDIKEPVSKIASPTAGL